MKLLNFKYKKIVLVTSVLAFAMTLSAFVPNQEKPKEEKKFTNLKVLPKSTTPDQLMGAMHEFNASLGVKCGFCHAPSQDDPKKLDFASDANKHKNVARAMMKMTAKINKKYFHTANKEGEIKAISCKTCHNGQEHPEMKIAGL
ncbi:c-type cytochrome [Sphingobacterium sp. SRCM116780]|uniref:c-type cytochrome n=1 Tax=Sphingobacterium sp. SRCM116780 TaxID=2907623 RepID=UPI001F327DDE|nr:c-type cytochrome [Sphingobacterium sp. SRCM116780]UIR56954.1 c-type cytochrome [Sphingobacterium sp. SRCM116780]